MSKVLEIDFVLSEDEIHWLIQILFVIVVGSHY